jgi:hypothetical protein
MRLLGAILTMAAIVCLLDGGMALAVLYHNESVGTLLTVLGGVITGSVCAKAFDKEV